MILRRSQSAGHPLGVDFVSAAGHFNTRLHPALRRCSPAFQCPAHPPRGRRGQALVSAIMALTVLTAAAVALSATARLEVRAARRGVDQVQRDAALRGGVNRGLALLETGRADPETLLDVLRRHRTLRWTPFVPDADPEAPSLEVAVQVLDASARVNLNLAQSSQLEKLPGMDRKALGAIRGWIEERSRDRYDQGPRAYEPKRRPFDTLEELLLVRDVDAGTFFGPPTAREAAELRTAPLSEWLTPLSGENNAGADGNPRANVNEADATELLDAANRFRDVVTPEQVETLIRKRQERQAGSAQGQAGRSSGFQSVIEALREAGVEERHWGAVMDQWTADRRRFLPGRINVNTAPPGVLLTLDGMTPELAEQLLAKREKQPEGLDWQDILDLASTGQQASGGGAPQPQQEQGGPQAPGPDVLERLFATRSSVYFVRCLVRERGSGRTDAAMALVYLPVDPAEEPEIVQWRQPDRFPGWTAWFRPLAEDEEGTRGR